MGAESIWSDSRLGRLTVGDSGGESGGADEVGISREMRFVVATDRPALCSERMRSAMLPPPVLTMESSSGLGDLQMGGQQQM